MKKMLCVVAVLVSFLVVGNAFAYDPGTIKGAIVQYNSADTDTVKISTGYGDCAGKSWNIVSEITTSTITDPNDDVFVYVYVDYSAINTNEDLTSSDIYTSTDEPAWDANKFGWYHQTTNTDDRCIGAVLWDDSISNAVADFITVGDNKTHLKSIIEVATDVSCIGSWIETGVSGIDVNDVTPVNAHAVYFTVRTNGVTNNAAVAHARPESGAGCWVSDYSGISQAQNTGWLYTGTTDRSIEISSGGTGAVTDGFVDGWEIER